MMIGVIALFFCIIMEKGKIYDPKEMRFVSNFYRSQPNPQVPKHLARRFPTVGDKKQDIARFSFHTRCNFRHQFLFEEFTYWRTPTLFFDKGPGQPFCAQLFCKEGKIIKVFAAHAAAACYP